MESLKYGLSIRRREETPDACVPDHRTECRSLRHSARIASNYYRKQTLDQLNSPRATFKRDRVLRRESNEAISVIDMKTVSKVFRTEQVETYAVRELTLKVGAGEFVAVTGHSGSGKTTLLNIAGLLEELDGGTYTLDGRDVTRLTDNKRSRIRNEQIGFIFQGFNLIPDLTIYDNVEEPLHYRGLPGRERHQRVTSSLERVGLSGRMKHIPSQLSGGQQQRAAIARAIAGEPRVILADEPTGNLDTTMSSQIMDLLHEINAMGTCIVMVTHNPELAQRAQRQIHMVDGQIAHVQHFKQRVPDPDTASAAP